jgi:hypothetical protein
MLLLLLLQVLEWKDYVRGKDLAKWLKERQELLDQHTRPQSTSACFYLYQLNCIDLFYGMWLKERQELLDQHTRPQSTNEL